MAFAPVILAVAFSLMILKAGGIFPVQGLALQGPDAHLLGHLPPSSAKVLGAALLGADTSGAEPPGMAPSGSGNVALGGLPPPPPCLGICFILAIYNTNSCLLTSHPSPHYPTQLPNSIHTALSLFTLSTCFSLGCSIS